jgi:hypothetical protein
MDQYLVMAVLSSGAAKQLSLHEDPLKNIAIVTSRALRCMLDPSAAEKWALSDHTVHTCVLITDHNNYKYRNKHMQSPHIPITQVPYKPLK